MLVASCRVGKKENIKNPSSFLLGENQCFAKTYLGSLLVSSQLAWVFFSCFHCFLPFILAVMLKKTSKTPRRSSSAKTMLRKNIFKLSPVFYPACLGVFFLFFWFSSFYYLILKGVMRVRECIRMCVICSPFLIILLREK